MYKNSLMSKFNMKGGGPLQKEAFEKTALFSVIRGIYNTQHLPESFSLF